MEFELKKLKDLNHNRNDEDFLCDAFFTCGIPMKNTKILLDSEDSTSSCKHPECSILPAMRAEILNKFPLKNPNFEINSTVLF